MPKRPPYTPGFGLSPPILAGRDDLLDDSVAALDAGPGHPRFCFALLGHRGVGKTSLLDAIGARTADELGWPVVHCQAMRDVNLLVVITAGLVPALGRWNRVGRDFRRLEKQLTVSVNLGVITAEANVRSPSATDPNMGPAAFAELLGHVGTFARDHDSGVLITVDEAMSARSPDLVGLAGAIQTIVNRQALPVAVIFAGLPSFREAIGVAGTFAERLAVTDLADLGPDASRLALVEPAGHVGVRWAPDALDLVARRSAGHPYYVQLFGYHTWIAAGGANELTAAHARAGIQAAEVDLHGQFAGSWARLRPQEQAFLAAVASIGGLGPAPYHRVADALQRSTAQLDVARNRLIYHHGLLRSPTRGLVQFRSSQLASWVAATHPLAPLPDSGRRAAQDHQPAQNPRPPDRGIRR